MTQTTDRPAQHEVHEVDLAITGMTCATCAGRVEKALSAVPAERRAGTQALAFAVLAVAFVEVPPAEIWPWLVASALAGLPMAP
mgnify:CR=1 FL=1